MKTDLTTAILSAIAGFVIAFLVCNIFLGEIDSISFKTIEGSFTTSFADPDSSVFNFNSINPRLETFVGSDSCVTYDENGNCTTTDTDTPEEDF